ncbi:hypothetical protein FA95DRAFT_1610940 [Auriscalpium vulgare]|uniref:Uncharacterized protein n=1 Tax=Auriscalpium vulgare TaxID=40419 RepID=A0ACB8RCE3_9AGAM|nr:hypothetical protein FA95DRAFT_1610940 [Auriscalpium vulgare]
MTRPCTEPLRVDPPGPPIDDFDDDPFPDIPFPDFPGGLGNSEKWWVKHRDWLQEAGYTLRRRYQADWTPSWKPPGDLWLKYEDGLPVFHIMDGTRMSDGLHVAMKRISDSDFPHEVEIYRRLTSEPLSSDPRNRTAPLFDVLQVPGEPGEHFLVMPLLRPLENPEFETFGQAITSFTQIF